MAILKVYNIKDITDLLRSKGYKSIKSKIDNKTQNLAFYNGNELVGLYNKRNREFTLVEQKFSMTKFIKEEISRTLNESLIDLDKLKRELPLYTIKEIANIILNDWDNVSPYAKPYLSAMRTMNKITDKYGADSGISVVLYFLSNAQSWKGAVAKLVKLELNKRVKKAQ